MLSDPARVGTDVGTDMGRHYTMHVEGKDDACLGHNWNSSHD